MNKKLIVLQNGYRDCAGACLLSIIKYYGGNISLEELNYIINTDKFGTNAYNMIEGMKTIGFDGFGEKHKLEELVKIQHCFPFIAYVKSNNNYHYIVIYDYDIKNQKFKVMDPAYGYKKIKYEDLKKVYLDVILIFKKVKEIPCLEEQNELLKYIFKIFKSEKINIFKITILSIIITIFSIIN
ncbi:hypothetical protein EOM09_06360, partial [bacterium]|nr:hypothetical protein [bacterium]